MMRRDLLNTAGLVALTSLTTSAWAMDHSQHKMGSAANALANAAAHCVTTGEACLAHCLQMLSSGNTSMRACATTVSQLIPLCSALRSLASQNSAYTAKQAKLTLEACQACKAECDKFPQQPDCKACADACAECIKQCQMVAG